MARREVERQRQLRLFGVGDLDSLDEGAAPADAGGDSDERWDQVHSDLLQLLKEEGFWDFLARRRRDGGSPGGL